MDEIMNNDKLFQECLEYYLYWHPRDPERSEADWQATAKATVGGLLRRKQIAENPTDNWLREYGKAE
jgi:hypothetical protein